MKDKFKKYSDAIKTSPYKSSSYDPKTFGMKDDAYYSTKKRSLLEELSDCINAINGAYSNNPSYNEIQKVLSHAIKEIVNLNKKIELLQSELSQTQKQSGPLNVEINGITIDLNSQLQEEVILHAVKEYIHFAIEDAVHQDSAFESRMDPTV